MSSETKHTVDIPERRERLNRFLAKMWNNPNSKIGASILAIIFICVIIGPSLTPHTISATDVGNAYASPSLEHPLGTDNLGRDLFTRVLAGGQTSLQIGLASAALALSLGVPIGLISGYSGGKRDEVIMRLMDVLLGFPTLILALVIISVLSGSMVNAIIAIGIVYSPRVARVVRGSTLSVKNEEYVQAAKVRGESNTYIIFREILPNIQGPIIVEGSIRIGYAILIAASLSFLGLGAQPPTPSWGLMIATSFNHMYYTPWFLIGPSVAIVLTIVSFNLLGDGLSDIASFDKYE